MAAELTDAEWRELFAHLLNGLRTIGAADVIAEIEQAAAEPIKEGLTSDQQMELLLKKPHLSRFRVRPLDPRERFETAVNVLHARLVDLPVIVAAIQTRYGASVELVDDSGDPSLAAELAPVRLDAILPSAQEGQLLATILRQLRQSALSTLAE